MICCNPSRRDFLSFAAVAAGTLLVPVLDPERAYAAAYKARKGASSPAHEAINLELVTLTESSFVITWFTALPVPSNATGFPTPAPGGTTVMLGTSPLTMKTVIDRDDATPYHYAEISGLEPEQTYYYLALSDGVPAVESASQFGDAAGVATVTNAAGMIYSFKTPAAPKGDYLFTLALCNDLHLGETVAGLAKTVAGVGLPPGVSTPPGEPPYAETMSKALVADVPARGAQMMMVAGDVSSEAGTKDLTDAKSILDTYGVYREKYLVARGNHDRCHTDSNCTDATCEPSKFGGGFYDHFREVWFPGAYDAPTWYSQDYNGLHVVCTDTYDKTGNGGDDGGFTAEQLSWFQQDITAHKDQPTLVFGHHYQGAFDTTQDATITALYAKSPGVFFQQAGHSHANALVPNSGAPNVTFQQTGSVKEYPGGFALMRVHTGGYAYNFYKTRADLAREWSERTREEYVGAAPFSQMGALSDRNHVREVDLSGLTAAGTAGAVAVTTATNTTASATIAKPKTVARREVIHVKTKQPTKTKHPSRHAPTEATGTLAYTGGVGETATTAAAITGAAVIAARILRRRSVEALPETGARGPVEPS